MKITYVKGEPIFEVSTTPDAYSWIWEAEQDLREALEERGKETPDQQKQRDQKKPNMQQSEGKRVAL